MSIKWRAPFLELLTLIIILLQTSYAGAECPVGNVVEVYPSGWHNNIAPSTDWSTCTNTGPQMQPPNREWYVRWENCITGETVSKSHLYTNSIDTTNPPLDVEPCCDRQQAISNADSECGEGAWNWTDEWNCEFECEQPCDQEEARSNARQTCGDYWQWTDQNNCEWDCEPCGQEKAIADQICGGIGRYTMDMETCEYDCDQCPNDPNKTEPGICGCGVPDTDSDGDGTPDCNDNCPDDPAKTEPGVCGCGVADTDSDGDGTPDCNDNCPSDPNKTEPGICGCGIPDTDSDGDGIPDCIDIDDEDNFGDEDGNNNRDC
jgi:hypothetical protein